MAGTYTIHLEKLILWGHHGLYAEETQIGQWFEVNIELSFTAQENILSIEQTPDYSRIYDWVKKRMQTPTPLLETLAQEIIQGVIEMNKSISHIKITIFKQEPPISTFQGRVGVSYSWKPDN